jgi:hypothetical protein
MRLSTFRVSASAAAAIAIATALVLAASPREFDRAVRMTRAGAQRPDAADAVHGHDGDHLEQPSFGRVSNSGLLEGSGHADSKAPADRTAAPIFGPSLPGLVRSRPASTSPLGRPAVPATGRAPPFA